MRNSFRGDDCHSGIHGFHYPGWRWDAPLAIPASIAIFFGGGLFFGIVITLPIGGADMPVAISIRQRTYRSGGGA